VARVAPDFRPKEPMATATARPKEFNVPNSTQGAANRFG
jgi:hypothetical protein